MSSMLYAKYKAERDLDILNPLAWFSHFQGGQIRANHVQELSDQ